jgi:DNA end-binding protein Ku
MRAIWKGSLSFGLVNIPVGLYPAVKNEDQIRCHLLRRNDLSPIKNKRVSEADGLEVPWEEVIKGYEYEKDRYVILSEEDFERVKAKSTQVVDIREFVDLCQIDFIYFDEPYYLAPEKGGAKAYALLREALKQTGQAGIAKVVLKTREYLAAVKPKEDVLVLELMHFSNEVASVADLDLPGPAAVPREELEMAIDLVRSMHQDWEPQKYRDEYKEDLMAIIRKKIAAGGKELPKEKRKAAQASVVDLAQALQRSLEELQEAQKK